VSNLDADGMNRFLSELWKAAAPTIRMYLICLVMIAVVVFVAEVVLHFIH
jgi:t-SNARE complex subunit (syntaxin)